MTEPDTTTTETVADDARHAAVEDARPAPDRLRRLHTLSGALVLGVFLVEHVLTNASALGGAARYDAIVGAIERSAVLPFLELLILVPLAFHAGYGIGLLRGKDTPPAVIDRYGARHLWVLQRITAAIVLAFVLVHLWQFRLARMFAGLAPDALHTVLVARMSWTWKGVPWMALFYLLGMGATAFHFSNGLFAATAAWGIATAEPARRRMRLGTTALGCALFLVGAVTVVGLATGTRLLPEPVDVTPCGSAVPSARSSAF